MKICLLDQTPFKYNIDDINSYKLRGAETTLINLAKSFVDLGHDVFFLNNCEENSVISKIKLFNINNLKENFSFDLAIANNDCNLFDKIQSKKKILLSHSIQSFEKFIRKKQFKSYLKYKPKVALLSHYHFKNRSYFTRMFGYFFLTYGVDDLFINSKLKNFDIIDKNQAIFTSRSDRNLDLLINLWSNKIYPNYKKARLLITPTNNYTNYNNIFKRQIGDRSILLEDLCRSRLFLVPGHKAELFCLAAEEARELCIPIVTLGIGSLSERVEHEKTGFIAKNENEFCDYTLEIFKNDDIWNKLRSNLLTLRGSKTWKKCSLTILNNAK